MFSLLWIAILVVTAVVAWPGGAAADKPIAPAACPQWEVTVGQATQVTMDARSLPQLGKPVVEQAPPGWEPFAFTPAGQLVYRRCASPTKATP